MLAMPTTETEHKAFTYRIRNTCKHDTENFTENFQVLKTLNTTHEATPL